MAVKEHRFSARSEMLDALYRLCVTDLQQALKRQSAASLLLSGGSTPAPLYRKLSEADLDWEKISIALVDERWVDSNHAASNEKLLRENMHINAAASARLVGMKNTAPTPFEGLAECNRAYSALPFPYSLCLLGMGPDSHCASLFPAAEGLDAALASQQACAAIRARPSAVTGDYLERMTLTRWSILQSQRLVLLITGEDKWEVYARARDNEASAERPISLMIHQQQTPLEVYWSA